MLNTKIIKISFIAITMCFAGFGYILGAPALPSLLEITQPNGAKFKAYLRGDEYFSWWESEKGTVLFRNLESGYFEYAKISMIDDKEKIVTTGVIFATGEGNSVSSAHLSKMTKPDIAKIWRQKREEARKRLQEILENRNNQAINNK